MEIFGIRRRLRALFRDAAETEQLRVQLAGVSVAALGGTDPQHVAKRGQYGWSIPYQDVLELRHRHDAMLDSLRIMADKRDQCGCVGSCSHLNAFTLLRGLRLLSEP